MFPFHEMFNINVWQTGVYFACHPQHFIARPPNLQFKPCCDCQQDCKKYGTCCIDLDWQHKATEMKDYYKTFEDGEKVTCQSVLKAVNHEVESVYMMKKRCNKEASELLVSKCFGTHRSRSIDEKVPVLGNNNYIYANKYCALCNNAVSYTHLTLPTILLV